MKILFPLDGSKHSKRALETAICIAQNFAGRIILMHVVTLPVLPLHASSDYPNIERNLTQAGVDLLKKAEVIAKDGGVPVEKTLKSGHAVEQILKSCKEVECDLIVIGARGISKIKEILLGSVSDGVTRYTDRPVMVVK